MHRDLTPRTLIGATLRLASVSIFLGSAACLAASVNLEPERAIGASDVSSESIFGSPNSKGPEDLLSAYPSPPPAEPIDRAKADSNLGDKAKSVLPEPPTWSLMLLGFLAVAALAYRRSRTRKRFDTAFPMQGLDRRRFQGRLQTAFSWNESDSAADAG